MVNILHYPKVSHILHYFTLPIVFSYQTLRTFGWEIALYELWTTSKGAGIDARQLIWSRIPYFLNTHRSIFANEPNLHPFKSKSDTPSHHQPVASPPWSASLLHPVTTCPHSPSSCLPHPYPPSTTVSHHPPLIIPPALSLSSFLSLNNLSFLFWFV